MPIRGKTGRALRDIASLGKEVRDLSNTFDHILSKFENQDLSETLGAARALGPLKELQQILTGTNEQYERMSRIRREISKLDEKSNARMKDLKRHLDLLNAKEKLDKRDQVRREQLLEDLADEKKNREKLDKLMDPKKIALMEKEWTKLSKGGAILGTILKTLRFGWKLFEEGMIRIEEITVKVFDWQDKLRNSLATLARRLGTTTDSLIGLHEASKASFLGSGGLGDLGFGINEITSMFGDMADRIQWTDKVAGEQLGRLAKLGLGLGMTAAEVGELTRTMLTMGRTADDAAAFMLDMQTAAARAGVTAKTLAKQFQGAGKALLELTGPKSQQMLIQSAAAMAKMGVEMSKMKGFVDMSDTFDKTAESMARLNTAFGMHINALQVFAEQDPAKRLSMVVEQMRLQGVGLNISRQERKLLAESLGLEMESVNAALKAAEHGEDLTKELEKQKKLEESRAETNAKFEQTVLRAKNVLITIEQISGRVWETMSKVLEPFFRGAAFGTGVTRVFDEIQSKVTVIDKFVEKVGMAFKALLFNLEKRGLGERLFDIGERIGQIIDKVMQIIASEEFASFVDGLLLVFESIASIVSNVVMPVVKLIVSLLGGAGKLVEDLWSAGSWVSKLFGGEKPQSPGRGAAAATPTGISSLWTETGAGTQAPTAAPNIPARADGGDTQAMMPYWVGERGQPELFVPKTDGTIIPRAAAAAMGGASEANILVQVILDGEIIQEQTYKRNLREQQ